MLDKFRMVEVPKGAKISKQKNGEWVQLVVDREYIKSKKYYKEKKVLIGLITRNENGERMMFPNEKYFNYFSDENIVEIEKDLEFSDTLSFGTYAVFDLIFKKIGVDDILKNIFGTNSTIIKALVCYYSSNCSNTIQGFKTWLFKNYAGLEKVKSESTISDILNKHLTAEKIAKFSELWLKNYQRNLNNNVNSSYVNIDSINVNTSSKNVKKAEYGYATENKNEPIINIGLVTDQINNFPLFYEIYAGSVTDMTQCDILIEKIKTIGIKDHCLVMDRGYFSAKNIHNIDKKGYSFIIVAKLWNKNLQRVLDENKDKFKHKISNLTNDKKSFGMIVKDKVFDDVNKKFNIVLLYEPIKESERVSFYTEYFTRLVEQVKNMKKLTKEVELNFSEYLDLELDEKRRILSVTPKEESFEKHIKNAGYCAIVTNTEKTIDEVQNAYHNRDSIEKMFRWIKTQTNLNKNYSYTDGILESKTFLTFISDIVRAYIMFYCKDLIARKRHETYNTIINELTKIEVTKISDTYLRRNAFTAKQKEILNGLELDTNQLLQYVNLLNLRLKK
ncbi:IS1634 family transposase [Mycoplasmopsis opalescens]|uniref:IS1634 family transposase n=1 Tax=Mycoplasmopsis opalescens TaxID=114886 RepID=UPI0004A6D426|nr:transposase [Mycoplasmopsis opalescens]